jgi:CubicO group peptidase (beta-lactamase class C family)
MTTALRLTAAMKRIAVLICALGACVAHADPGRSADGVAARLISYLQRRPDGSAFSGVVLVQQHARTLLRTGMGSAELELSVGNAPDLIYRIGSLTKPFTAIVVMTLRDRGAIKLQDSVCRYLSPCPPTWSSVTVRNLLNHTSGIPDLFGDLAPVPVLATRVEISRILGRAHDLQLESPAGSRYAYSNFNYMLLGDIIEVASGNSYDYVLRQTQLDPLQLRHTAYDDVWAIVPRRVIGYARKGGHLQNVDYHDHAAFSAGGLRSSADDLLKWSRAFFAGEIVSPATVNEMVTPTAGDYGFGWQTQVHFGRVMHNHTGGITGFASHLAYYPADDLTIILLSNVEDDPVKNTALDLASIVLGS